MNINIDVLKKLLKHTNFVFYGKGDIDQQLNEYKENAIIIEKSLKALEIIKNKKLDVYSFINNFVERNNSYETYVLYFENPIEIDYCVISEELLTKEEFDLLQEVLL